MIEVVDVSAQEGRTIEGALQKETDRQPAGAAGAHEGGTMTVSVYIPTPFRHLVGNRVHVQARGRTVRDVLADLDRQFPGFRQQLFGPEGKLATHINVYVNQVEIGTLQGEETPLREGDEVAVIPALAGGAVALTPEMVERYSRHIIMPQVGSAGQRKIMEAKVLIIGAGGLGSPVAIYLALAGVGTIGLVDFDVVDRSNLQRQILHQDDDVGRPKVVSAKETLLAYNPYVNVETHETPLTSDNAFDIIAPYDIVVNGADNFATRYLVNDACYLLKKPLVDGSILMFDGQATTYLPGRGCYRCLYPAPPPPGMVPSCAEAGVLGAMCATIGSIQATEVLKLILGIGEPLVNRLLLYDALALEFRIVRIRRDPNCPLCGDNPTITQLIDYEAFCGAPFPAAQHA
ncbi:MAG: molybdopterin-synthase adenylyltransferase MoeB [Dehalococcoidia bacterium]|nr:molybdopterin-synthase adenylyltransferase MoeB [Dehalococcoidia bacterium]